MSWLCLNCETVNFDAENKCIVCNEERYYSSSEVKQLLENHPETKALREQVKKLNTQNKWLQTRNKNLTQENKQLQSELQSQLLAQNEQELSFELPSAYSQAQETNLKFEEEMKFLQRKWQRKVRIWQIGTLIATCMALFLFIYKK
ncbi:MAG: hypothetical protein ACK40K_08150 [Raineya sp.]